MTKIVYINYIIRIQFKTETKSLWFLHIIH